MKQVYDLRRIEGISTISIIRNGGYHLFELPVYEDGSFDCWHRNDLAGIRADLERRWLVCSVPEGESIGILGLASILVERAEFQFNENGYYKYLEHLVRSMNRKLEGLYIETDEQKEKSEKYRIGWNAKKKPFKVRNPIGYFTSDGESTWVFYDRYATRETYEIAQITAYEDGTFALDRLPEQYLTLEEVSAMFQAGVLSAEAKKPAWFRLGELGRVYGSLLYEVGSKEKQKEIEQKSLELTKQPTAYEVCQSCYYQYLRQPSEEHRRLLKEAYEKVPEHERCYLGDMDTRDTDYQRIIYYPEKKREV